jgi:alpha-L-fucosidase 2
LHNGGVVTVSGANEATLYLVAATNFISPIDVSGDSNLKCMTYLEQIKGKNYDEIKKEHVLDYKKYFERFSIDLGVSGKENMPTDDRIINIMSEMDNSLAALYVQYSRYLMLSSSRPGTYPANLQGIWNHKLAPPWDSKYTVNINTEMNYWPVEPLNISECHSALFKMLEEVVPSGRVVAKEHYDARGWVLHHNTDIWRGAAPINASNHGIWVTGGAWLSQHFWEHYLYSGDKKFLEEQAWPILKESALFFTDFLVEDPKTGWLVSVPSNSPENGGLVSGPTMDHQIIRGLFRACIECSEILGEEKEFASELKEMLPRIAPNQIGQHGQLQEWVVDNDSPRNKHRHVSHLWGVYPGKEINWNDSPELMKAARQSLLFRGDEGTGWSLAWKINFWSRFRDGNHAWQMVRMLLSPALHPDRDVRGGSYPNLFDAHPPFQIDGNFGGAAGIVEMLIQSHLNEIELLPALPDDVPDGSIKGVRSRGGFELDFAWKEKKIIEVKVVSSAGNMLRLRYGDKIVEIKTQKGEELEFDGDLIRL